MYTAPERPRLEHSVQISSGAFRNVKIKFHEYGIELIKEMASLLCKRALEGLHLFNFLKQE